MGPQLRKWALILHVSSSVGWLGAVVGFFALAVVALVTDDAQRAQANYLAMNDLAWLTILPACLLSLASGFVQSLGTPWGLLQHWWVVVKLTITVLSTIVLLIHMRPIGDMADIASTTLLLGSEHDRLRLQLVVDSGAAVVALLTATTLSILKPRGQTPFGTTAA